MPASVRTLSQLPGIVYQQLDNKSKFEVSVPVEVSVINSQDIIYKFASKSITAEEVSKKISVDIRNGLIESNGLSEGVRIDDLCAFVSAVAYSDFTFDGTKDYLENPTIDNSPLSSYSLTDDTLNDYSVNYGTLKKYSNINCSPSIGPNFGFVTRLSGFQSGSHQTERMLNIFKPVLSDTEGLKFSSAPYFVFNTNAKNVVPNEYIFKIEPGKRESKSWVAPASGIFTCYGWLDEINNPSQANESRWVALMGKQAQLLEKGWSILQVQPFIKNNYLSYVGFTFPVKKGMELKIVTGFAVGNNSDKYFSSNSSLANHIGNAFLGGIYTGLSADDGSGNNYDYGKLSDETNVYLTSADLSDLWNHEASCDLSVKELIDDLSSKLSNNVDNSLSGELSNCVKYIDAAHYTTALYSDTSSVRYTTINFGNGRLSASRPGAFRIQGLQSGWYGRNNPNAQFDTLSINWADSSNGQIRVMLPQHTTIDQSTGQEIIHGYDYYLSEIPGGAVFSDGLYFYYCVSQDSTVQITLDEDPDDTGGSWMCCRMLFGNDRVSSYRDIRTVLLATQWETYSGNGTSKRTTLPLKKGTILMFEYFIAETLKPLTDNSLIIASVQENDTIESLGNLINNTKYHTYSREVINNGQKVNWYARLVRADGSNIFNICNDATSTDPKKKSYATAFGRLARIVELP